MRFILTRFGRARIRPRRKRHAAIVEPLEPRVVLSAYTVRSTADDGSEGTLRWAITQSLQDGGLDTIVFDLPGNGVHRIDLASPLPEITSPVVIDGTTQHGFGGTPLIQIDGSSLAEAQADGLVIKAGASMVRGLTVTGFSGAAILLRDGSGNLIVGNYLGLDASGQHAAPNGTGLRIVDSSSNLIGGGETGQGNVISGNFGNGVEIVGAASAAGSNVIAGNIIGTTADGLNALGNGRNGVFLDGAVSNQIGGSQPGDGNLISGNDNVGIRLIDQSKRNWIAGNLVGTMINGKQPLGNQQGGILIEQSALNLIGGLNPGDGNVVSANLGDGIRILALSDGTLIQGNQIGTDRLGSLDLGNSSHGIFLASSNNQVGGQDAGAGNLIAFNGAGSVGSGVKITGPVNGNAILSNAIHDNAGLGISFGSGPTPIHQPGSVPGPNDYQNYPMLSSVLSDGQSTRIVGALLGLPSTKYTIQYFWSPEADPSGYGEGRSFVSSQEITTDASGNGVLGLSIPTSLPPGSALSATATDPKGNTSEFSPVAFVKGQADLVIAFVAAPTPIGFNGVLTYSVTVRNVGSVDATNVILNDSLPPQTQLVNAQTSQGRVVSLSPQSVLASLGTIRPGAAATLTLATRVLASPGVQITNSATATLTEIDPTPGNNSGAVTTTIAATADLSVTATADTLSPRAGQEFTLTVVAHNAGPSPALSAVVSLPFDASVFTVVSAASPQGDVSITDGRVSVNLVELAADASATITLVLRADRPGSFGLQATIASDEFEPTPANNQVTTVLDVLPVIDLTASLASNPSRVTTGQEFVLTLTATNQGINDASDVSLEWQLPANATVLSATTDQGVSLTAVDGRLKTSLGSLVAGGKLRILVILRATAPIGATLESSARLSGAEEDSDSSNDEAAVSIPVRDVSNPRLTMMPNRPSVPIGQPLTYTLVVTNDGPADDPDVTVTIPLPSTVNPRSVIASQGTAPIIGDGFIRVPLGALVKGATASIQLTLTPRLSALGLLTLGASVKGENAILDEEHAKATAQVEVTPSADLAIAVRPQPGPAHEASPLTYTFTVSSRGPSPATDAVFTSAIPDGVDFVSASSSQGGQALFRNGVLTINLGALDSDATATVTVVVRPRLLVNAAPAPLTFNASVTASGFDPDGSNNAVSRVVTVEPSSDLSVVLTPTSGQGEVGQTLYFLATIRNAGPSPATDVTFRLPLSAQSRFIGTSHPDLATSVEGDTLIVHLGSLAAGEGFGLGLALQPLAFGPSQWLASISGSRFDLNADNNQGGASVAIADSPGILQFSSPQFVFNDTAGYAVMTVTRSLGTRGEVSARYQTQGGDAVPGWDYTPTAGVLTFADGVTSQTIVIPLHDNSHFSHDLTAQLVLAWPTGGAVLGATTTTNLLIHETTPDITPPHVSRVDLVGNASAVTAIVLSFDEALSNPGPLDRSQFLLQDLGTSGSAYATPGPPIPLDGVIDPAQSNRLVLIPAYPLPAGIFFRIQINGAGVSPITDLAGNVMAGNAGANYDLIFGRGATLKYLDRDGDAVSLKVTRGGYLDVFRGLDGEGQIIRLQDGLPGSTTITGTVSRSGGRGTGRTTIDTIEGLGNFGDIRVNMTSPPFIVRQYPAFLFRPAGQPARATARPLPPPPRQPIARPRLMVNQALASRLRLR